MKKTMMLKSWLRPAVRAEGVSRSVVTPWRIRFCPVALMVLALLWGGCGRQGNTPGAGPARPAMPVETRAVEERDLTRRVLFTGSVEPTRIARMASPAEGPVVECVVREGDPVQRGQLLVRVGRSRMAESELAASREELRRQQSEFQRIEQLVSSGALPGEQREIALSALKRAEAQVAAAETSAGDYDVRAPWDGVVSEVFVSEGNYVAPRVPLVDLYDPASLRVRFAVPERDARRVEVGTLALTTLDSFPGQVFDAPIERIYPRLDPATRTLMVEANLMTDLPLFVGLFARVATPLETVSNAVVVPSEAPVALPDGSLAVFVAQDGRAQRRIVRLGVEADGYTQILEGIEPGESVVVRGQESLREGSAIRILAPAQTAVSSRQEVTRAP